MSGPQRGVEPGRPPQGKPAFRGVFAIWSDWLDRNGPKNPAARFVVELIPWLAFFGVLSIILFVAR